MSTHKPLKDGNDCRKVRNSDVPRFTHIFYVYSKTASMEFKHATGDFKKRIDGWQGHRIDCLG
jgi:hypothetical protein